MQVVKFFLKSIFVQNKRNKKALLIINLQNMNDVLTL